MKHISVIKIIREVPMAAKTTRNEVERKGLSKEYTLLNMIIKGNEVDIERHTPGIIKHIGPHIQEMSAAMSTSGPEKRIVFTKVHEDAFIKESGVKVHEIEKAIKDCKIIGKNFITYSNPFYILMSNLISYHYKKKTMVGKGEVAKILTLYLALRIYKAAFGAFFPNFIPNKETMDATIERLGSNRFNVKKYKTMFNTIVYIAESHYENFRDILEDPIDDNIIYYISNLYGRIKLMMRLISNKYYDNHKKGIKQTTDSLQSEAEDGEMYLNDVENVSTLIAVNSRKIYLSFVSDTCANPKILRGVCQQTEVSYSKMTLTINLILENREPLVESLLIKMLSYFYQSGGKTIKSVKFINSMIEIYKVSNTSDETILAIKDVLHQIMDKYSDSYRKTNHAGLLSNLKKTLHIYIALYAVDRM